MMTGHTFVGAGVAISLSLVGILLTVFGGAFNGLFAENCLPPPIDLNISSCPKSLNGFHGVTAFANMLERAVLGFESSSCRVRRCLELAFDAESDSTRLGSGMVAYSTTPLDAPMGGGPRFLFGLTLMGDVPVKAGGAYRFDVGCTRLRLIVGMVLVGKTALSERLSVPCLVLSSLLVVPQMATVVHIPHPILFSSITYNNNNMMSNLLLLVEM